MTNRKAVEAAVNQAEHQQTWAQMSTTQRVRHVGKVVLFFLTFGFAFPTLFSD